MLEVPSSSLGESNFIFFVGRDVSSAGEWPNFAESTSE